MGYGGVPDFQAGYRADGLRAWKQSSQTGGTKRYYLYDGGMPLIELDASGNVAAVNAFAPDGLVSRASGGMTVYYSFDQQGNISGRTDSAGAVVSSSGYAAFGYSASFGESQSASFTDPFGFNAQWGYYLDREHGYYLCGHRYYGRNGGRWLTRDPIGVAGGVNLYSYCGQGPIGWSDPSGEMSAVTVALGLGFPKKRRPEGSGALDGVIAVGGAGLGGSIGGTGVVGGGVGVGGGAVIGGSAGTISDSAGSGGAHNADSLRAKRRATLSQNVLTGRQGEIETEAWLRKHGFDPVRPSEDEYMKCIETELGYRVPDFYVYKDGELQFLAEVKTGNAPYADTRQEAKDKWIERHLGIPTIIFRPPFGRGGP